MHINDTTVNKWVKSIRKMVDSVQKLSHRCVLILFPLKNGLKMRAAGGGEKSGLHFNDKFSWSEKDVKNSFLRDSL